MINVNEIFLQSIKIFIDEYLLILVRIFLPIFIFLGFLLISKELFKRYSKMGGKRRYSRSNNLFSAKGKYNLGNLKNGFHFEEYVADLLLKLNYKNLKVLPPSNDYGTDLIAELNGITYAIQCKYYSNPVGIRAVQEIMGGKRYYNTHLAVVVTNNKFTYNAKKLAEANKILLWDGQKLQQMIKSVI